MNQGHQSHDATGIHHTNSNISSKSLKNVTREAHTKEVLIPKSLNYRLYVDLIQKITELIIHATDREPIVKVDDKINEINNVIKFMNNKKVFPKCKPLDSEPSAEQFITTNNDEGTMAAAHQVLSNNIPDDQIMAVWRKHREACRKSKDKDKMFDQMNSRYTNLLNSFKTPRRTYRDPKTNLEASFAPPITSSYQKTTQSHSKQPRTLKRNNRQHTDF